MVPLPFPDDPLPDAGTVSSSERAEAARSGSPAGRDEASSTGSPDGAAALSTTSPADGAAAPSTTSPVGSARTAPSPDGAAALSTTSPVGSARTAPSPDGAGAAHTPSPTDRADRADRANRAAIAGAASGPGLGDVSPGDGPESALGVGEVLAQVKEAIAAVFPPRRRVWVRGEIQKITESQRGHCYIDLADHDAGGGDAPTLKVNCWRSTWVPLRALLAEQGVVLAAGTVVTLAGRVDFYAVRGQLTFVAEELDVDALLGRMAAERAELIARLQAEGLLERNQALPFPEVPLRVGLVASPRTEGCADFLGRLHGSGFAFRVLLVPVTVQGIDAPGAVAAGIAAVQAAGCDVVVLVRGGGARADLVAFDHELVARAVATSSVPVWTGIGHTGDQSVADLVAHTAWPTPTACGQALADQVGMWWAAVARRGARLAQRAEDRVATEAQIHAERRRRLVAGVRHQLFRHGDAVAGRAQRIVAGAARSTGQARVQLVQRSDRAASSVATAVVRQSDRVTTWRRLVAAYDVDRQLARGYTLTFDGAGHLVRQVHQAADAGTLVTRFVDGSVRSTVVTGQAAAVTSREPPAP